MRSLSVLLWCAALALSSADAQSVAVDAIARDVVTNIRRNTVATRTITYQLGATVTAGVVPVSSRTVTLTIIQQP